MLPPENPSPPAPLPYVDGHGAGGLWDLARLPPPADDGQLRSLNL